MGEISNLNRVYTSTFGDWFSQAVIDFLLGNRGPSVFTEFLQNLSSSDPRDALRLSKVREAAIENASAMVILGDERVAASWTLLSPVEFNVRLADYFEEKILILVRLHCVGQRVYDSTVLDIQGHVHCCESLFDSLILSLKALVRAMTIRWKR